MDLPSVIVTVKSPHSRWKRSNYQDIFKRPKTLALIEPRISLELSTWLTSLECYFLDALLKAKEARQTFRTFWSHLKQVAKYQDDYEQGSQVPSTFLHHSKLSNIVVSYNPLQPNRFPDTTVTLYVMTQSINQFNFITDEYFFPENQLKYAANNKLLIWGPLGTGKSFAAVIDALELRMSSDCFIVLINNPLYIVQHPQALFYELIYACPDDEIMSEDQPDKREDSLLHLIRTAYDECAQANITDFFNTIRNLMKAIKQMCKSMNRPMALYLDQVNSLWNPKERRAEAQFLRDEFVTYFDKVISISSATNEILLDGVASGYTVRKLIPRFNTTDLELYIKACLNQEEIDEEQISDVSRYVGRNIFELSQLLRCPAPDLAGKIKQFGTLYKDRINTIRRMHEEWMLEYGRIRNNDFSRYIRIAAYLDTGIEVELSDLGSPVIPDLDHRFIYYDPDGKILNTISPAARIALNMVVSSICEPYLIQSSAFLDLNMIPNGSIRGMVLEQRVHSVFFNRLAETREPKCWQLKLLSENILVHVGVDFTNSDDFQGVLSKLKPADVYYPIIAVDNFPVTDAILVNPFRMKTIFLKTTTNPREHIKSVSLLFDKSKRSDKTKQIVSFPIVFYPF